jgi:hypothetical protein
MDSPAPTSTIDRQVQEAIRGYQRYRWYVLIAVVATLVLAVVFLSIVAFGQSNTINRQQRAIQTQQNEIQASCDFYGDLGELPLIPVPPAKVESKFAVNIVLNSRHAYFRERCPLPGPPLAPSVIYWAKYYHLSTDR